MGCKKLDTLLLVILLSLLHLLPAPSHASLLPSTTANRVQKPGGQETPRNLAFATRLKRLQFVNRRGGGGGGHAGGGGHGSVGGRGGRGSNGGSSGGKGAQGQDDGYRSGAAVIPLYVAGAMPRRHDHGRGANGSNLNSPASPIVLILLALVGILFLCRDSLPYLI